MGLWEYVQQQQHIYCQYQRLDLEFMEYWAAAEHFRADLYGCSSCFGVHLARSHGFLDLGSSESAFAASVCSRKQQIQGSNTNSEHACVCVCVCVQRLYLLKFTPNLIIWPRPKQYRLHNGFFNSRFCGCFFFYYGGVKCNFTCGSLAPATTLLSIRCRTKVASKKD